MMTKMYMVMGLFCALLTLPKPHGSAQQTINYTIQVESDEREFIVYVPASYTGSSSVPLVFSFHGLGGNAQVQMEDHDFRPVADTAGFIVVHPLGLPVIGPGIRGWNFVNDELPDDVLFTSEMIDAVAADFNIDLDRVYACGMSFGGFFSVFLAGQLSDRIAAVASVAGTVLNTVPDEMVTPSRPLALLEIHGTDDINVAYDGSQASQSVQYVLDLFVDHNGCDPSPSIMALADSNPNDGSTVEHYIYANGEDGTTVEHLKVIGGGHTWPGENTSAQNVNRDINGCVEIWKFFSKFDMNGYTGTPLNIGSTTGFSNLAVYPNPAQDYAVIESDQPLNGIRVYTHMGQELRLPISQLGEKIQIDLRSVPAGVYVVSGGMDGRVFKSTLIKQ